MNTNQNGNINKDNEGHENNGSDKVTNSVVEIENTSSSTYDIDTKTQ